MQYPQNASLNNHVLVLCTEDKQGNVSPTHPILSWAEDILWDSFDVTEHSLSSKP